MTLYVVMKYVAWETVGTNLGIGIGTNELSGKGFLPVFLDREEAEKAWPGATIQEVKVKE